MANELAVDQMRGGLPEIVATPSMTRRIIPLAALIFAKVEQPDLEVWKRSSRSSGQC